LFIVLSLVQSDGYNCAYHVMINMYKVLHELPLDIPVDLEHFRILSLLTVMDGKIMNHPAYNLVNV
jgi:hypothetical protein